MDTCSVITSVILVNTENVHINLQIHRIQSILTFFFWKSHLWLTWAISNINPLANPAIAAAHGEGAISKQGLRGPRLAWRGMAEEPVSLGGQKCTSADPSCSGYCGAL
jgi:hypothetical protein